MFFNVFKSCLPSASYRDIIFPSSFIFVGWSVFLCIQKYYTGTYYCIKNCINEKLNLGLQKITLKGETCQWLITQSVTNSWSSTSLTLACFNWNRFFFLELVYISAVSYSLWCSKYQGKIYSCATHLGCQNRLSYSGQKIYSFNISQCKYSIQITNLGDECFHSWKTSIYIFGKNYNFVLVHAWACS